MNSIVFKSFFVFLRSSLGVKSWLSSVLIAFTLLGLGACGGSVIGEDTSLTAPQNLRSTVSDRQIVLTWDKSDVAEYYIVEYFNPTTVSAVVNINSYVVTSLTNGVSYTFKVKGINGELGSKFSQITAVPEFLLSPQGLTTDITDQQVTLTWEKVASAERYVVKYSGGARNVSISVVGTSYVAKKLTNGTTYAFAVKAIKGDVNSAFNKIVAVPEFFASPQNLRAIIANQQITLEWDEVDKADRYVVEYANGSSVSTTVVGISYVARNLTNDVSYIFRVKAVKGNVSGVFNQIVATPEFLDSPQDLKIVLITDQQVTLSWDEVADADQYIVEYYGNNRHVSDYTDLSVYNAKNLTNDVTYTFRVKVIRGSVSSAFSQILAVPELLASPQPLKITSMIDQQVTLTWGKVVGAERYVVEYSNGGNGVAVSVVGTSYVAKNLTNGATYTFKVRAIKGKVNSAFSQISAVPQPLISPQNLRSIVTDEAVTLEWDEVDEAEYYVVEYTNGNLVSTTVVGISYIAKNLSNGVAYTFKVKAVKGKTGSAFSQIVATPEFLTSPQGLKTSITDQQVTFTWEKVAVADHYLVEYYNDSVYLSDYTTSTLYTAKNLTNDVTYTFRVRAVKGSVRSAASQILVVPESLAPPKNLKTTAADQQVALTWTKIGSAERYLVEYSNGANGSVSTSVVGALYVAKNLTNNVAYTFKVKAIKGNVSSAFSPSVRATPQASKQVPSIPTGLEGTAGTEKVTLKWNFTTGATSYLVIQDGNVVLELSDITAVITGLFNNTVYRFKIQAKNSVGVSDYSEDEVRLAPLAIPTALKAEIAYAQVTLSWNTVMKITSYTIRVYAPHAVLDYDVKAIKRPSLSLVIPNLIHGENYRFKIQSLNELGVSDWSTTISVTILSAPTGLTADVGTGKTRLTWDSVASATSYVVIRDNTTLTELAQVTTEITGLVNGKSYQFKIRSKNSKGYGAISSSVMVTPLAIPEVLGTVDSGSITLYWDGIPGATEYKIYDSLNKIFVTTLTNTEYTFDGLSNGITYSFQVKALSANGESDWSVVFNAVPNLSVRAIALGNNYSCALLSDGRIKCWGLASLGRLGNGQSAQNSNVPVTVLGIKNAVEISVFKEHACARLKDGTLRCWGRGANGQLGNNDRSNKSFPVRVKSVKGFEDEISDFYDSATAISVGEKFSCAIDARKRCKISSDGDFASSSGYGEDVACSVDTKQISCWGSASFGAFGDKVSGGDYTVPHPIGITDALALDIGDAYGCALFANKSLKCWGNNSDKKIGGFQHPANSLTQVEGMESGVTAFSTGYYHTCAVRSKQLYCWGTDRDGVLGLDPWFELNVRSKPTLILDASNVLGVDAGKTHTCASFTNGEVKCWGRDSDGQLGNGDDVGEIGFAKNAHKVEGLTIDVNNPKAVVTGKGHTCAIQAGARKIKCWGENSRGQLGNGTNDSSHTAVDVKNLFD